MVARRSQKYFSAQQTSLGAVNGYIEEMISGQKVIKVFCHENVAKEEFALLNKDLRDNQIKAQFFGGIMWSGDGKFKPGELFPDSLHRRSVMYL